MTTHEIAVAEKRGMEFVVPEEIKKLLAPKASDNELIIFCKIAQSLGLNPYANEIYLIPFGDTHSIVIAVQAYLKRASHNPQYETYQAGLIVSQAGGIVERKGTLTLPGDKTIGAWCKVWKKGAAHPFEHQVKFEDWDKKSNVWQTHPNHMIYITAIRQCIRMAFPDEYGPEFEAQTVEGVVMEVADVQEVAVLAPPETTTIPEASTEDGLDYDLHPWLRTCPLHNISWQEGKYGPYHIMPGRNKGFCNQKKAVTEATNNRITERVKELGWEKPQVASWVEEKYGKTWGKLGLEQRIEASELQVSPVASPETAAEGLQSPLSEANEATDDLFPGDVSAEAYARKATKAAESETTGEAPPILTAPLFWDKVRQQGWNVDWANEKLGGGLETFLGHPRTKTLDDALTHLHIKAGQEKETAARRPEAEF